MQVDNLTATQLELENIAHAGGINRYKNIVTIRGHESTPPGQRLVKLHVEPLATVIDEWLNLHRDQKRGRKTAHYQLVKDQSPAALAYLTVKTVLGLMSGESKLTGICRQVGNAVESHVAWLQLKEQAPGLEKVVGRQLRTVNNEHHRMGVTRHVCGNVAGISRWSEKDCIDLGRVLVQMLVDSTDLVTVVKAVGRHSRAASLLLPTESTLKFLFEGHERCQELAPMTGPMVCPPADWTNMYNGGYLSIRKPLVRSTSDAALAEMESVPMPEVYSAVNTLQRTAYSVNRKVLDVMLEVWKSRAVMANVPSPDPEDNPAKPADIATNTEALKAWKSEARKIHKRNQSNISKRLSVIRTIKLGEQYSHYDAIYFPHNVDWRGRAYPISTDLQPQGDDFSKGLLQYAEAKPIGEDGFAWLKVHIANVFGVDKVSMADRVKWVDDNHERLINIALDPLDGDHYWCLDDDGLPRKESWQALAACYEYAAVVFNGTDYPSRMIVPVDGSCNGLQNLSAMLRDPVGGAAVNLTPADKPADIYTQVAKAVEDKLHASDDPMASEWLSYGISRLLVKRAVMTKPYGVTNSGMRNQIVQLIENPDSVYYEIVRQREDKEVFGICQFLTTQVDEAINEIVVASKEVMTWLREVTRIIVKEEQPVFWTTPLGFHVQQNYRKVGTSRAEVHLFGQRLHYRLAYSTDEVDKRRSTAGTSPNVVHSLDATHMMMTVNAGREAGLDAFTMVHDSFGTHAADIGELGYILREQFVRLYSFDILKDLQQQFVSQVPTEVAATFPELPEYGTLDINEVMESMYFFA